MGKLTDTKLRAMKPNGKVQKESDGDGLYAYIGAKSKAFLGRWLTALTTSRKF